MGSLQTSTIKTVALIQSHLHKNVHLLCLTGSKICLCLFAGGHNTALSSYNSNGDISLTAKKDGFILISSLHMKFRSVNCIWIRQSLKQLSKHLSRAMLKSYMFSAYCFEHLQTVMSRKWKSFFERNLILDIQTTFGQLPDTTKTFKISMEIYLTVNTTSPVTLI